MSVEPLDYQEQIKGVLQKAGYRQPTLLADTLQGSVWRVVETSSNKSIIVKVTNKHLSDNSIVFVNGMELKVHENIDTERRILKCLSDDKLCPASIVKFADFFQTDSHYFLLQEDGGDNMFEFTRKAHQYIASGLLDMKEWHKLVQIIFKQMVESIDYLHAKHICHFDVSLENFVISDLDVERTENGKLRFCSEHPVHCKLVDFGLSQHFANGNYSSVKYCGKTAYQSPEVANHFRQFDARANDVWCLGVCLFMMTIGCEPFETAKYDDQAFNGIMNGELTQILKRMKREHYVNDHILELLDAFFQHESNRVSIQQIKSSRFFKA
eukprot:CAMPEP_0197036456 /NCGR_PEP_ID=MMETSP1384-20130603/13954_1 /TAXON_ID=29189 /ORGANISM="Ammonia sp." /LENGTH=324 /DNA_ID=CAMNT_0042466637 /DNA_START=44 /DNA_END=1018 /DNA_ORIENTATION=-